MTEPRRHLIYHAYPVAGRWQSGIDQLRRRRGMFTGSKSVAVARDPGLTIPVRPAEPGQYPVRGWLDPWEAVRDYAADLGADVFPVPNDPSLREVASWRPLWDRAMAEADPDDFVFYAHAKGVTRPPGKVAGWVELLYAANLDFWPRVAGLLARHLVAGAFKRAGRAFPGCAADWHYAGSFYWVRAGGFRPVPPPRAWWGVEAWPGLAYRWDEAGCVFDCDPAEAAAGVDAPAWRAWAAERAGSPAVEPQTPPPAAPRTPEPVGVAVPDGVGAVGQFADDRAG